VLLKTSLLQGQKTHSLMITKLLLNTVQMQEQVPPKTRNRKSSCSFIFGDTSHFLQYNT
jgi:hypothetical protein